MLLKEVGSYRRRLQAAAISVMTLLGVVASNDVGAQSTSNPAQSDQAAGTLPSSWQSVAGGHLEFEVASVRPSEPGSSRGANMSMNIDDYLKPTGGLFTANYPPYIYIVFAYKLMPAHEQEKVLVDSLPKWASTQAFTVHARAASSNPTKDQYRLMMQSLLADRFKFVYHLEQRKVPVFALTLVKAGTLGPSLRPHSSGPPCTLPASESGSVPSPDSGTPASGDDSFPFNCGRFNLLVRPDNMVLTGSRDVTIGALARWLSGLHAAELQRPVTDQTGLKGSYDFSLKWGFLPPPSSPAHAADQPEFLGQTVGRALNKQLGLYLKPTVDALDFVVVDHIEMPSPN